MTGIALDIGCGGTLFVRRFRRFNKKPNLMYLCGEPQYRSPRSLNKLLVAPRRSKIVKVQASYNAFPVPDRSLDMVTLNAFHAFMPPIGIEDELVRTMKPGGFFFSAHPIGMHPKLPEERFLAIGFDWDEAFLECKRSEVTFWRGAYDCGAVHFQYGWKEKAEDPPTWEKVLHYPASRTIEDRLLYGMQRRADWYIYTGIPHPPTLRVWIRT